MDELITYLINFALAHSIGVTVSSTLPIDFPSSASSRQRKILFNTNWQNKSELPFILAHEIGHLLDNDEGINYYSSPTVHSQTEYKANCKAVDLLLHYCRLNDINVNNPVSFCEQFGIPAELEYIVALKMKGIQHV